MEKKTNLSDLKKFIGLISTPLIVSDSKTIVFCNESASELTGYEESSIEAMPIIELFERQSSKSIQAIIELAAMNSQVTRIAEHELRMRRKTGRLFDVSLSVSSYQFSGSNYFIISIQDLTHVKKQESERRQLLEETARISKLADIGRLTAGMAHELNNPLSILSGYLENLSYSVRENDISKESLMENIIPIENASKRMARIIRGMLAKIRDEKIEMKSISLLHIVKESLILLQGILDSQSIELKVEVEPDIWINGDSTSIEQIITNIITNACNALDSKKERLIRIRSKLQDKMVSLEVWNNGDLIPDEIQKKIFTPFFTTKQTGEGTGLGLFMSYQVMKTHNGELGFYSNEQAGTAFVLNFPQVASPKNQLPSQTLRAIVIDDDTFFRRLLVKKLEKLNFTCEAIGNGEDALKILKERKASSGNLFDVVFVDFKMPRMNGVALALEIKKSGIDLPIILVSGAMSGLETKTLCEKHDFFSYLTKPIDNSELQLLVERISELVENKKAA